MTDLRETVEEDMKKIKAVIEGDELKAKGWWAKLKAWVKSKL